MPEKEFNLLDEPWIKVLTKECKLKEVSLMDVLVNAHIYVDLAGELRTQDICVLRLLSAVLHTVFSRVDVQGNTASIETPEDAILRWQQMWEMNHIPVAPVKKYLETQHEKFWLFHPTNPFWQVPEASKGTEYSSAKLNGTLSESGNKARLFKDRLDQIQTGLTYPEAARWLLNVNAYDDTSAKPKGKNLPSPGVGWLGKLGLIIVKGRNLFETLLLNLTLLKDGTDIWSANHPTWELGHAKPDERTEIAVPDNPAELLTLQSRRLLLRRQTGRVTGYNLLGGDFFNKVDAFTEQMTIWRPVYEKKVITGYQPRRHDSTKQLWRDFSAIITESETTHIPGVIAWLKKLIETGTLSSDRMISFEIASVQYGDKDFFVCDFFTDSLSFHANLLSGLGLEWQARIVAEISRCDSHAKELSILANNISLASGGPSDDRGARAKEAYYSKIDIPFRHWLRTLNANNSEEEIAERVEAWHKISKSIAIALGKELAESAGSTAFVGRDVKISGTDSVRHYSSPEAFNWFTYNLSKLN